MKELCLVILSCYLIVLAWALGRFQMEKYMEPRFLANKKQK